MSFNIFWMPKKPFRSLIVTGSPDPWTLRIQKAMDEAFIEKVLDFSGCRHKALENELVRQLIMPALRADVEMHERCMAGILASIDVLIAVLRDNIGNLIVSLSREARFGQSGERRSFKKWMCTHVFENKIRAISIADRKSHAIIGLII